MKATVSRRRFVASAATASWAGSLRADAPPGRLAEPFPLDRVRLSRGPFLEAAEWNRRFLHALDPDRLLHMFRVTARIGSPARPLGGWEAPENELRGHFTGHYLSACALRSAAFGDETLRQRGNLVVAELARCQAAHGDGYLSAFPQEFFERLRAGKPVWAPWYTLHKIMAGLLDMHQSCGNAQALDVLKGMAAWARRWTSGLDDDGMAAILQTEFGGMNEVLCNLYAVTYNPVHLELAHRFDHRRFFDPLAAGRDELKGLHANTNIPKVIGAARRYELTGDARYRDIAGYFWREITTRRAYCTGGTSNDEVWRGDPGKLAAELGPMTQECCCTYNMLKLTRHVFCWTADARCADYYERALFNGTLGTISPEDGMTMYYVPLASGYWKLFGLPEHAFWCCTGTGAESFSKLGDSIYFHDQRGLFVNLFIASELDWREKGLRVIQETDFPRQEGTALRFGTGKPVEMELRIRIPYWAARGVTAKLNGVALEVAARPGSYWTLARTWRDGDRVELSMPMSLHVHPMPDDQSLQAILYGPLVLAGRLGAERLTRDLIRAEPTRPRAVPEHKAPPVAAPEFRAKTSDPASWIQSVAGQPLTFRTTGQARDVTFVPFYQLYDERYAVYWRVRGG